MVDCVDDAWLPEEGRPLLRTFGATLMGCGVWAIAVATPIRETGF